MPQFDPSTFASQIFWLVVCFVALFILMTKVALPQIASVLEERQFKIDDNLEKAATLKIETEDAIAVYEKALAESKAEAQRVIRETAEAVSRQAEQRQHELAEQLAVQIRKDEERIHAAKRQSLESVREVAVNTTEQIVEKLLGSTPKGVDIAKIVTATMEDAHS